MKLQQTILKQEVSFRMSSLALADSTFEKLVQEFPVEVDVLAREFGAFARSRVIRNPSDLLRSVLLYCGLDYSLREVAANFTGLGRRLSDEAVRDRLCACEPFLRAMLQQMLPRPEGEITAARLILVDSTTVESPGARSIDHRIHLGWDWIEQKLVHMVITDMRTGESLRLFEWRKGDLAMADAGYAKAPQVKAVVEQGADFIVRCVPGCIRLYSETGELLDIASELKKLDRGESIATIPVRTSSIPEPSADKADPSDAVFYLHAFRLSENAAERARRKARRKAQKSSYGQPKAKTLYLAEWMLILTSLEPERMSPVLISQLYRARWQIELVIKRLKSIVRLGALRARRGSRLAQVYLLGKSLYALIVEKQASTMCHDRTVEWRIWKMTAEQIRPSITLSQFQTKVLTPDVLQVLKERPRTRKRLRELIEKPLHNLRLTYCESNV